MEQFAVSTNKEIKDFLKNVETIEVLIKKLKIEDIKRLSREYPNFLDYHQDKIEMNIIKELYLFLSVTLLKYNTTSKYYFNLKKIRVYINLINDNIIKILHN